MIATRVRSERREVAIMAFLGPPQLFSPWFLYHGCDFCTIGVHPSSEREQRKYEIPRSLWLCPFPPCSNDSVEEAVWKEGGRNYDIPGLTAALFQFTPFLYDGCRRVIIQSYLRMSTTQICRSWSNQCHARTKWSRDTHQTCKVIQQSYMCLSKTKKLSTRR